MLRTRFHWMSQSGWSRWAAAVLVCPYALALANPQPVLGTLFYTPVERQQIDRARLSRFEPESGAGGVAEAQTSFARLSGVVRRAGGKGTVWINGAALTEGTPKAGQIRGMDAVVDGHRLRVGESIDKSNGTRMDVVEPGAVTVRRRP